MALLFGPANRVDGLVDELDEVEFVKGDLGVGQTLRGAVGLQPTGLSREDEGQAHVDAHLGDGLGISAMGRQVLGEGIDRAGVPRVKPEGRLLPAATNRTRRRMRSTNRLT